MTFSENLTHTGLSESRIFWLFTLQSKAELTQLGILSTSLDTHDLIQTKPQFEKWFQSFLSTDFGNLTLEALFFCLSYVDLRKFGKIWLYLRYPCCSSMNFDPSPVDKYNSVNSPNSGCNLKLSIVERFSRCLIKVKLPYCSSRDFSSPVDKNNSVNSSNRKGWLSVYERLPRFRTII